MKYFAYCRKSQEAEERQALSIPAQKDEVGRVLKNYPDIQIVEILEEARTAKSPGRAIFNAMLTRIEAGEADGIIAWHPDRLARNSVDGGLLIYLLDRGVLKDLKFSTYTFENSSQGKFMLQIMFGYSKYYVDSLSENVKRGNRRKLEQGVLPGPAPLGYRNDPETHTIVPDPRIYPTVRRIWSLVLAGGMSIPRIRDMTEHEWGFRVPQRRKTGGGPLSRTSLYRLLGNRFYAGIIAWKGEVHAGRHQPMVTLAEFERVQTIIGRPGRPARQRHAFAYTGMMRCGSCGCAVTAEVHVKRSGIRYEYYRCTKKRRDFKCSEPYIELASLESQIAAFLRSCNLPDELHAWAVRQCRARAAQHEKDEAASVDALRARIRKVQQELSTLTDLRVRNILDDGEFLTRRNKLRIEIAALEQTIEERQGRGPGWLETVNALLSLSKLAVFWFENGNAQQKRQILSALGSNCTLSNKTLNIEAMELLKRIPKTQDIPGMLAFRDDVRTFSMTHEGREVLATIVAVEKSLRESLGTGESKLAA